MANDFTAGGGLSAVQVLDLSSFAPDVLAAGARCLTNTGQLGETEGAAPELVAALRTLARAFADAAAGEVHQAVVFVNLARVPTDELEELVAELQVVGDELVGDRLADLVGVVLVPLEAELGRRSAIETVQ
jgi:hypothetical protein